MKISRPSELPELIVIDPLVHGDHRGFLLESWHLQLYAEAGISDPFVQDVHSHSLPNVLRGMHFQHPWAQGKLVRVTRGAIIDVAVDVRIGSPTFSRHWSLELSGSNCRQLWIPPGFAHGFLTLSEADVQYRCTAYYAPDHQHSIAWNDPDIGFEWPSDAPVLSEGDAAAPTLRELERMGALPGYRT